MAIKSYKIKQNQFCALSKNSNWQEWLRSNAIDLYYDLKDHLKGSTSCNSNKKKMIKIRKALHDKGLDKELLKFLKVFYPTILTPILDNSSSDHSDTKIKTSKPEDLNKHKVFGAFFPGILVFPHKFIIADFNRDNLMKRLRRFIKNKLSIDYIIIGDRAYIEYFEPRYSKEAAQIDDEDREIYQFKKKHGLTRNVYDEEEFSTSKAIS